MALVYVQLMHVVLGLCDSALGQMLIRFYRFFFDISKFE